MPGSPPPKTRHRFRLLQDNLMEFARSRKKPCTISLIPLIDVSMFLLIFFMLAGTVQKFEIIPIAPPAAESGKLVDEGHIQILLGTHGEVVLGDDLIDEGQLEERIRSQLSANPNKIITIKADSSIAAIRMIRVMDLLKAAGGRNLSIATQSSKSGR